MRRAIIAYNGYDSGLGNRVRVVLGAKSLADLEGRDLVYVWPTGPLFGPRFHELWDFRGRTVSRAVSRALARVFPYEDHKLDWVTAAKRKQLVWQIRTGSPLQLPPGAPSWQARFRSLRPVEEISGRVTTFFNEHLRDEPYVGVMIRAHQVSHPRTRDASPVEWFTTRMEQLQAQAPGVRFFVSCDVPDVQANILERFPTACAQTGKGGYNTVAGVRSSVVDLYLLASSGYLLGPHFSSFIHLAEHLAGDQLVLETSQRPRETGDTDFVSAGLVDDPLVPARRQPVSSGGHR